MKVVLIPYPDRSVRGQDVIITGLLTRRGMQSLNAQSGEYPIFKKPTLITSHSPDNRADLRYARYYKDDGIPIVSHVHCRPEFYQQNSTLDVLREMLKISTVIVVPHRFLGDELISGGFVTENIPIIVISNGANSYIYGVSDENERQLIRTRILGNPHHEKKLIGYIGSFTDLKGSEILSHLCTKIPDGHVMFLQYPGWPLARNLQEDGATARELANRNSDNIIPYPDPGPRLPPRPLRAFDVLISLSKSEVQPLTVLEALVCGVPVVATRSTPFYRDIENNSNLKKHVKIIDLPLKKDGLKVKYSEQENIKIAKSIWKAITELEKSDLIVREEIHTEAKKMGFLDETMYNEFFKLYELLATGDYKSSLWERSLQNEYKAGYSLAVNSAGNAA